MKNSTRMGATEKVAAAMSSRGCVPHSLEKESSPTMIGRISGVFVTINGQVSAFQDPRKLSNPTVMKAGLLKGTTTRQRKVQWEAPSIVAASCSSWGIVAKNWTFLWRV